MSTLDQWLSVREAASILHITPGRVRQLIIDGRLRAEKKGNANLLPRRAVEAFGRLDRPNGRRAEKFRN